MPEIYPLHMHVYIHMHTYLSNYAFVFLHDRRVDPDTRQEEKVKSYTNGKEYVLIMSDEFEEMDAPRRSRSNVD